MSLSKKLQKFFQYFPPKNSKIFPKNPPQNPKNFAPNFPKNPAASFFRKKFPNLSPVASPKFSAFFAILKNFFKNSIVKKHKFKIFLAAIFFILIFIFWPIRAFFSPKIFFGKNLILFFNEAELRPCGGFVTAAGIFSIFPPRAEIKNSYFFAENLGPPARPLQKITPQKNFWDAGENPNLHECAAEFRENFAKISDEKINAIWFLNFATIEKILQIFGPIKFENKILTAENFFAEISREVANIDRHDENKIKNRKNSLPKIGQILTKKIIFKFWKWRKFFKFLAENLARGEIFGDQISGEFFPQKTDFTALEWNAGGAKTSRFLRKIWRISAREIAPENWKIAANFSAENLGGVDEPISQIWRGEFEFLFPEFLEKEKIFVPAEIKNGEIFQQNFNFEFRGKLPNFAIFRHRGQKIFAEISISLFPQKNFSTANFSHHENVGEFFGEILASRKKFIFSENADKIAPFVTFHEKILCQKIAEKFSEKINFKKKFCAEIHFSEKIKLQNFAAKLVDRDFSNSKISENLPLKNFKILPDERSIFLIFSQNSPQKNERFFLEISGVADFFGNKILPAARTIIDREKN